MAEYDSKLMHYFGVKPSPKQARLFVKLAGIPIPRDIPSRAGAGIAIGVLIAQHGMRTGVRLPAECFCTRYSTLGNAIISSLVDAKYANGMTIAQLTMADDSFKRVNKVKGRRKVIAKHIQTAQIKRPAMELTRPKLAPLGVIRRR